MSPDISIVMSCYNEEVNVSRAIESILNQSFTNYEFIIIDDCSNDGTPSIIQNFMDADSRIVFLKNTKNLGLAASLNKGIEAAKAQYIARMDADDFAYPHRLESQFIFLKSHPNVDILGTGVDLFHAHSGKKGKTITLPSSHQSIVERAFKKTLVFHPTVMMNKKIFTKFGFYNPKLKWAEDSDLWLRIYDKVTFHNLPEPLLLYTVKSSLNFKIVKNNLYVKWINLKRRKLLLSYSPILAKDAIYQLGKMFLG